MALSVREIKCAHNSASEETEHVCDWCQSIIDFQPQKGWNVSLSPEEHERAMTLFGGPDGTSKRKWQTLQLMTRDMPDVQWARLPADIDPIVQPPESWSAFEALVAAVARGDRLTHQHENMLREGIVFYDGSTLRFLDSAWNLNGVHLQGLSLSVVFALLGEPEKRRGWDIPGLLVGAVSVNPDTGQAEPLMQRFRIGRRRELRPVYRPLASMLAWLSNRLKVDRTLKMDSSEYVPMMAWSHDIQTCMFERHPANMEGLFQNALSNHPPGLFHAYNTPWMRAWQDMEPAQDRHQTQKWALDLDKKRLRFRVRTQSGALRLIHVPNEPALWALLSSLALSPLNSNAGKLLIGLQHNWTVPYGQLSQPSQPLVRSMRFCHDIMNGLDGKIHVESARALVFGRLGHVYEIAVQHGQHGAPYTIQHITDINPNDARSICIHSGQFTKSVPLGDTMGGVLLSMVNDVAAAHQVDSLEQLLHHHAPFGFPRTNIPPGFLNALDLDSISAQSSHRYFIDHCRWMRPAQRRGGERRVGHGLHELLLRNRHQQRNRSRTSERWTTRFHEFFERNNRFPYAEVVAEWRTTVRNYEQHSAHHRPGDVLARGREDFLHRRYHHLMPHRRSDDVHDEGDVRDGERRWCEVFARVWEVLVYQPLGSTFHVPTEDGQSLVFEHAGLQATVRTPLERNFFMRVAKLLGYVNDESGGPDVVYVRRDHPRPNARLRLTELLQDAQERQRVRGAPPRWWNYVDVVTPPQQVPHLRWQLHIDHRDAARSGGMKPPDERPFSGLGDLFG